MGLLVGFLLPLMIYLLLPWVLSFVGRNQRSSRELEQNRRTACGLFGLTVAGLWIAIAVYWIYSSAPQARGSRRLSWVGVSSDTPELSLRLGGAGIGQVIRWPSGWISPEVTFSSEGELTRLHFKGPGFLMIPAASIAMAKGLSEQSDEILLGGVQIRESTWTTVKGRSVTLRSGWFGHRELEVQLFRDDDGPLINSTAAQYLTTKLGFPHAGSKLDYVRIKIPRRWSLMSTSSSLKLDNQIHALRAAGGAFAAVAEGLEAWSLDIQYYAQGRNFLGRMKNGSDFFLSSSEQSGSVQVKTPCAPVLVLKPKIKLAFRLERSSTGGPAIWFYPPWRLTAPLPEARDSLPRKDGNPIITFTATAQPGEACFLLPVGGRLAGMRITRTIRSNTGDLSGSNAGPSSGLEQPQQSAYDAQRVVKVAGWEGIDEMISLEAEHFTFHVAHIIDQPNKGHIAFGLLLGLITMLYGYVLVIKQWYEAESSVRDDYPWYLGGILAGLWAFLCLRVLLALRYCLTPEALDSLTTANTGNAFAALPFIPVLVMLLGLARADAAPQNANIRGGENNSPNWISARPVRLRRWILYLLLSAAATIPEFFWGSGIWKNLPDTYQKASKSSIGSVLVLLIFFLVAVLMASYGIPQKRSLIRLRNWVTSGFELILTDIGPSQWNYNTTFLRLLRYGAAIASVFLLFNWALLTLLRLFNTTLSFYTEVWGNLVLIVLAGFWMGSKGANRWSDINSRGRTLFDLSALGMTLVLILAFVFFPFVLRDQGYIYASGAIILTLCIILVCSPSRIPGALAIIAVVGAAAFLFIFVFITWSSFTERWLENSNGSYVARLISFREGPSALERMLRFRVAPSGEGPSAVSLGQALQHAWANRAMMNQGGWPGMHFGEAPDRNPQIPVAVLQYDSVFSIYIVGEHGLVGGLALILMSAYPLIIAIRVKPPGFQIRFGFILMILTGFFLEAAFHAGMNMNWLPFTGRNYPLLAVGSVSDLLHWSLVFALASQAFHWGRSEGDDSGRFDWSPAFLQLGIGAIIVLIGIGGIVILRMKGLETFDLSSVITSAKALAEKGNISWNQESKKLVAPEFAGSTFLGQEVNRFNVLSPEEQTGDPEADASAMLQNGLVNVTKPSDFDALLARLSATSMNSMTNRQPSLFRLTHEKTWLPEGDKTVFRISANEQYNSFVSLKKPVDPKELPIIMYRGEESTNQGVDLLSGPGFQTEIKSTGRDSLIYPTITLEIAKNGEARIVDNRIGGSEGRIYVRAPGSNEKRLFGRFKLSAGCLMIGRGQQPLRFLHGDHEKKVSASEIVRLEPGDRVCPDVADPSASGFYLAFGKNTPTAGALIGPAWVMGKWRLAAANDSGIPWLNTLAEILNRSGSLLSQKEIRDWLTKFTIDRLLQKPLQEFVRVHGRELYAETLESAPTVKSYNQDGKKVYQRLPPRAAISIIDATDGEVLALGGWPCTVDESEWITLPSGEVVPPVQWLERKGPWRLKTRYLDDRNFDRMLMGSITKPIWAAGVLAVHPKLDRQLVVFGGPEMEQDIFGIPLHVHPWKVPAGSRSLDGGPGCDFQSYIALSDNRYQVRLGFLGLSEEMRGPVLAAPGTSLSDKESMDGGKTAWHRFPKFAESLQFNANNPGHSLMALDEIPLFEELRHMFGLEYRDELDPAFQVGHRVSFWSGDRRDDVGLQIKGKEELEGRRHMLQLLEGLSPASANLALNLPPPQDTGWAKQSWTTRDYVNILLGGGTNAWANVDFAGAFASAVIGRTVTPHITSAQESTDLKGEEFVSISESLRPGMRAVLTKGTAHWMSPKALNILAELPGVNSYAKTGTLDEDYDVSRIALALIRWKDKSHVDRGLVISIAVERGKAGQATRWLGDLIESQATFLREYFAARK